NVKTAALLPGNIKYGVTVFGVTGTLGAASCKAIFNAGLSSGDGVYLIAPDGVNSFPAYCDMTSYGGGWTLVARMTNGCWTNSRSSVGTLTSPTQAACAKISDATINSMVGADTVFRGWHDGSAYPMTGPRFLKMVTGEFNVSTSLSNLTQQCSCSPTGPWSATYSYHSTMAGVYNHGGSEGWRCVTIGSEGCDAGNTNGSDLFLYQHALNQAGTFPADSHSVVGGSNGYLYLR
ncbi:MAG: fibrinogen-like YCDxxxxGGGW domain-containing protein, partial [Dehalococcoidia bacterium]|nr:fibrinogen-like YCDxxxxGGGW domain-containing protein [Dehalococcoidia bacterium]